MTHAVDQRGELKEWGRQMTQQMDKAQEFLRRLDTLEKVRSTVKNDKVRTGGRPEVGQKFVFTDPAMEREQHHVFASGTLAEAEAVLSDQLILAREWVQGRCRGDAMKLHVRNLTPVKDLGPILERNVGAAPPSRLLGVTRRLEEIVGRKGGTADLGSSLKKLYEEDPKAKEFLCRRGGIGIVLRMTRLKSLLRVRTTDLGGKAELYLLEQ